MATRGMVEAGRHASGRLLTAAVAVDDQPDTPDPHVPVDASMASVWLIQTYGALVSPATIRKWGERGEVSRKPRGAFRYDLAEVVAHARRRGLLDQ